jgi:cytochrome c
MKKTPVLFVSMTLLVGAALSSPAAAGLKEEAAARGAKLFADSSLGTNGKSCASCHADTTAWAGKPRFPKFALGAVRTLDQAIQTCITNALQGRALPPDDEKLTALAVYTDGLYGPAGK